MATTTLPPKRSLVAPVRLLLILGLAASGVFVAACGTSGSATTSTSQGSSTGTNTAAAFQSCLANHGVTLPKRANGSGGPPGGFSGGPPGGFSGGPPGGFNGTPPSGGVPPSGADGFGGNSKFQKAIQACASLRPKGARGPNGAASTAFAAFRNCMKLHGVTVGAFGPGTSGTTQTTVDTTSAAYQAAATACQALLPAGGAPPASGAAG